MEKFLEILAESDKVKQRTAGLHLDQQIQVTTGTVLTSCRGAKQADIAGAVARRDSKNVLTLALEVHAFSDHIQRGARRTLTLRTAPIGLFVQQID